MNTPVVHPDAIIVCGLFGSGKTTIAKMLSVRLSIPHVSTGDFFRKVAAQRYPHLERTQAVLELGRWYEKYPDRDIELDDMVLAEVAKGRCVADGRVTAALAKRRGLTSLKVQLLVDPHIGASRVAVRESKPVAQVLEENRRREEDIARRLKALYGVEESDPSHYDLIVDTDPLSAEQVLARILDAARPLGYALP